MLDGTSIKGIVIYDTLGKEVLVESISKSSGNIALTGLANGVYIASFQTTDKGTIGKKFILK